MKEVITYVAFDDMEFDTKEQCIAYENQAHDYITEIMYCYTFYDKNMEMMPYGWSEEILEELNCISVMYNDCECIRVHGTISREAYDFLRYTEGILLPVDVGMYTYDYSSGEWV